MNEEVKRLIREAMEILDDAIDEIESDDLGNDPNYTTLSGIISTLDGMID